MDKHVTRNAWPLSFGLGECEVHVWSVWLNQVAGSMTSSLSPDEHARAGRFRFKPARDRFIAGRAALRSILARYLQRQPCDLVFSYGPYGKPQVGPLGEEPALRFNLSHARDLAVIVVAQREVGIDLEWVRPNFAYEGIVEQFFSPSEQDAMRRIAALDQSEWFFACWTVKEAYVKAIGRGLTAGLDVIEVDLSPSFSAVSVRTSGELQGEGPYRARLLRPAPGYIAAVVTQGGPCRLRYRTFTPEPGEGEGAPSSSVRGEGEAEKERLYGLT